MAYSTSEGDSDPDNEYDSDSEIQTIYTSQPIIAPLTNPTPIAQVHLLLDTYSRLILVIALFDTGVAATILHPRILPQEFWLPHHQMFRAANGVTFLKTVKSKPILIRIFPTLTSKHQVLGSLLQTGTFSLDLISFIKYQALDDPQKGSCINNTFLLGPKYPICLPWIPLTP